jgi:iron complex transport system substrate-binding protein
MSSHHAPSRIVSLQPSITLTLAELGALNKLVACTKYCADVCPEVRERKIPLVHDSWTAEASQITALKPDLVLASVPYQMESLAEILKAGVALVCLSPKSLHDVYGDIALLASIVNRAQQGDALIEQMKSEIADVRERAASTPRQTVYCEEWGKPLIQSQGWVAELIEAAGGEMIGVPGATTTADSIRDADPDIVLAAWCGAGDRVPLEKIVRERRWSEMKAAKSGRVFCINDELLNTPAHCLVGGLRAIAWALHPHSFDKPVGIRRISLESKVTAENSIE